MKEIYKPEFEGKVSALDMGYENSRWAFNLRNNIAIHGYKVLNMTKFKNLITETIIIRKKSRSINLIWLDKDGKAIADCFGCITPLTDEYIKEYAIPHAKSKDEVRKLEDRLSGDEYPLIGKVTLIKTYRESIKEMRLAANLTQEEFSKLFEIPLDTVKNWDSGRRTPPAWAEKLIIDKLEQINGAG